MDAQQSQVTRSARFEVAITISHRLLPGETVTFDGQYSQAHQCELRSRDPLSNGPPIPVGSRNPRQDRIAAQYADTWNAASPNRAADLEPRIAAIDAECEAMGRDPLVDGVEAFTPLLDLLAAG